MSEGSEKLVSYKCCSASICPSPLCWCHESRCIAAGAGIALLPRISRPSDRDTRPHRPAPNRRRRFRGNRRDPGPRASRASATTVSALQHRGEGQMEAEQHL